MKQVMVGEIARATGLHENTIRRYADRGYVEAKRDFLGRRFFPEPMKTVKRIRGLLNGEIQLTEEERRRFTEYGRRLQRKKFQP